MMSRYKKYIPAVLVGLVLLSGVVWNVFLKETSEPERMIDVYIALGNNTFDPAHLDCTRVFLVPRTIRASEENLPTLLRLLLVGPTSEERVAGYFTSINDGVSIRSYTIRDAAAYVDFDKRIEERVGGSCRVAHIRSQIEYTLRQVPGVERVVISVEGRVEDALQP